MSGSGALRTSASSGIKRTRCGPLPQGGVTKRRRRGHAGREAAPGGHSDAAARHESRSRGASDHVAAGDPWCAHAALTHVCIAPFSHLMVAHSPELRAPRASAPETVTIHASPVRTATVPAPHRASPVIAAVHAPASPLPLEPESPSLSSIVLQHGRSSSPIAPEFDLSPARSRASPARRAPLPHQQQQQTRRPLSPPRAAVPSSPTQPELPLMPLSALGVTSSPPVMGRLHYAWRCDGRRQVDGWPADTEVERRWTERMRHLAAATPALVVAMMVRSRLPR
jgi:hypothetical protein